MACCRGSVVAARDVIIQSYKSTHTARRLVFGHERVGFSRLPDHRPEHGAHPAQETPLGGARPAAIQRRNAYEVELSARCR